MRSIVDPLTCCQRKAERPRGFRGVEGVGRPLVVSCEHSLLQHSTATCGSVAPMTPNTASLGQPLLRRQRCAGTDPGGIFPNEHLAQMDSSSDGASLRNRADTSETTCPVTCSVVVRAARRRSARQVARNRPCPNDSARASSVGAGVVLDIAVKASASVCARGGGAVHCDFLTMHHHEPDYRAKA